MTTTSTRRPPRLTLATPTRRRTASRAAEIHRLYRDDPNAFSRDVLGRAHWPLQAAVCADVAAHGEVVVRSGNAVGKSFAVANLVLWWLSTRPGSLAVTTAPSQALLGTVLWKEIRRAAAASTRRGWPIEVQSVSPRTSPQELRVPGAGSTALGIATRGVERLSGQHAADLLVAVDEASGIDDEIAEALDSLKPTKSVWIGNPLRRDGRFWALHEQAQAEQARGITDGVAARRIRSTDGPHAGLEVSPWGLADKSWLRRMARRYGVGSRWWTAHIEAEFPEESYEDTIPRAWIEACREAERRGHPGEPVLAVDLAAGTGRDRTVLLIRDALGLVDIQASPVMGLAEAAAAVARICRVHQVPTHRVVYDAGGLLGKDFPAYLERVGIRDAYPYYGSGRGGGRYGNLRTRCAWTLRRRLCPDPIYAQPPFYAPPMPHWADLVVEVCALRHTEDERQVIHLESKDKLSRSLGRSPDLVDALIMSFALDPIEVTT